MNVLDFLKKLYLSQIFEIVNKEWKQVFLLDDFNINFLNQPTNDFFLDSPASYFFITYVLQPTRVTSHLKLLLKIYFLILPLLK